MQGGINHDKPQCAGPSDSKREQRTSEEDYPESLLALWAFNVSLLFPYRPHV